MKKCSRYVWTNHNLPGSYFLSLTSTSYPSIITVVTVVETNDIVWTIYQSRFTATTTNIIQIDATSSSTKIGIDIDSGTCKNKIVIIIIYNTPILGVVKNTRILYSYY